MKNIKFLKIYMTNFFLYKEPMELEFKDNKIIVISGPNGCGKTTMIADSIAFTLFGITTKGLKGTDVVNNEVKKNCHTSLEFMINTSHYKLDRYYEHYKHRNDVYLYKDKELIKKGHNEVIVEIERLLVPQKLFLNTLLFGQNVKNFFTDLADSDQKDIFRKILLLDEYEEYKKKVIEKINNIECELENIEKNKISLETGVKDCDDTIDIKEKEKEKFKLDKINSIGLIKNGIKKLEKELSEIDNIILSKETEINNDIFEKLAIELHDTKKLIYNIDNNKANRIREIENSNKNNLQKLNLNYNVKKSEIESEYTKIISELENKKIEKNSYYSIEILQPIEIKKNEILNDIKNIKFEISHYSDIIKKNIELIKCEEPICNVCKQEIKNKEVLIEENKKIQNIINEKNAFISNKLEIEINALEEKKEQIKKDEIFKTLSDIDLSIKKITDEKNKNLNELKNKLSKYTDSLNEDYKNNLMNAKKESDQEKIELNNKLNDINIKYNNINNIKKEYEKLSDEKNHINESIIQYKTKLSIIEGTEFNQNDIDFYLKKKEKLILELKDTNDNFIDLTKNIEILNFWKQAFSSSGIPSMLIDEAIPFMNNKMEEYLKELSNERYRVTFNTLTSTKKGELKDKINVDIFDNLTKANKRKSLSGGQTRLIDIATIFTLYDLQENYHNISFNLLIMDEIFDSLDDENIGYVCNVLRKLNKNKSVYIISHRHIDNIPADEILNFYSKK